MALFLPLRGQMKYRFPALTVLFILNSTFVKSQSLNCERIVTPDSILSQCEALYLRDAGEEVYKTCIRFDSTSGIRSLYSSSETRLDYCVYHTITFPSVAGATFGLKMYYSVYDDKGRWQSGRFLWYDRTDLAPSVRERGTKMAVLDSSIIDIEAYNKSQGYNNGPFILGQDGFYWHFVTYYPEPNPQGDAETIVSENTIVDPYTGKVIREFTE